MSLPPLDDEERRRALDKAAAARRTRAALKEELRQGAIGIDEVLRRADEDEAIGRAKVSDVLEALPNVGKVRAQRLMDDLGISPSRRLRGLGANQRARLSEAFSRDRR